MNQTECNCILEQALRGGADFAELYFEDRDEHSIKFNQVVRDVVKTRLYGAGIYLIAGTQTVYAYTSDVTPRSLQRLCELALQRLKTSRRASATLSPFICLDPAEPNPVKQYPASIDYHPKVSLLNNVNKACMGVCAEVRNLDLSYFDTDQRVTIVNSEGVWAEDRRVTSRIRLFPTLSNETESLGYFTDFTRPAGFEVFADESYVRFAQKTIAEMRTTLYAADAPSGLMPVVLAGGDCSGTFFHEACGHQFESQAVLNNSAFAGKIGQKVASDRVTLIDDGTLPGMYGSSKFDDEGMPRQKNILIENGIMKSYLSDRIGALRLNAPRTASGRKQGYAFAPAARMSNTYLAAGIDDPDEMIRSLPEGLYVTSIGGGNSGREFTLAAQTAYLIKNGQIDRQVKGATLSGRGTDALFNIDRVGNKLVLEDGGAFCGNVSGLCPTTTSGARMRISEMLIGGKGEK